MNFNEIKSLYDKVWRPGYGAVSVSELMFLQEQIGKVRPRHFIEIGMASGLSTGFIARFMENAHGATLTSVDHDDTFFGDPSKPNGFLVPDLYTGKGIDVRLIKHKTALDVHGFDGAWEMAFIDANHQHPWPLIDTLALWPSMAGPKIIVHHDLTLYLRQDVMFGIGPKYLYDQVPCDRRSAPAEAGGNIFMLDMDMPKADLEELAILGFKLPWSLRGPLSPAYVKKIREMLARHYSEALQKHFDAVVAKANVDDRFRSGL